MNGNGDAPRPAWIVPIRQCLLQWVFPFALAWSVLLILVGVSGDLLQMNPFPEGGAPHRLFEEWIYPAAMLLILAAMIALQFRLLRRFPGFLRLPGPTSLLATALRLAVHGAVAFCALTVGAVFVQYLFYDPAKDPQGQFHIWVWLGGFLYGAALAPLAALVTVWWAARRLG